MHNIEQMAGGSHVRRALESVLSRAAREFPAIVLTGPRQAGKTTLLRKLFGETHRYLSLEAPDIRAAAQENPRGFLGLYGPPVILDEVQNVPELLPYIQERIDERREEPGQFLLSGSQNLLPMKQVPESLAGRAAILHLLPLSNREAQGRIDAPMPWEADELPQDAVGWSPPQMWEDLLRGGYPELVQDPARDVTLWHSSYIRTYLERDVRALRHIGDLTQFQLFLRAVAARSGQLFNMSDVGRDLGLAVNTVKAWLSVLEATHQIAIVRPYFANVGKRLVKTPKVYFLDTGTLCYLTGLRTAEHAALGPMGGPILETAVLGEIYRTLWHRGLEPRVYFWRTSAGSEVDFLVEDALDLVPIEVELASSPRAAMARGIVRLKGDLVDRVSRGFVVHTGPHRMPLRGGIAAIPFREL